MFDSYFRLYKPCINKKKKKKRKEKKYDTIYFTPDICDSLPKLLNVVTDCTHCVCKVSDSCKLNRKMKIKIYSSTSRTKYQMASVKALVQVDFPVHALTEPLSKTKV